MPRVARTDRASSDEHVLLKATPDENGGSKAKCLLQPADCSPALNDNSTYTFCITQETRNILSSFCIRYREKPGLILLKCYGVEESCPSKQEYVSEALPQTEMFM